MAVSVTTAKLTFTSFWTQENTITGHNSSKHSGPYISTVSPTVSSGALNRIYNVQATLAFGATATIDVFSLTESAFGTTIAPVRIYSVHIKITGATGRYIPGATNALVFPFNDSSDAINFNAGDSFLFASTTATTVSSTLRNIRIINTHGSDTLTYSITLFLGV